MKKLILFLVFLLAANLSFPGPAAQEQEKQESDLVKLKKKEEERRKKLKQPSKTVTNETLEQYEKPKKKSTAAPGTTKSPQPTKTPPPGATKKAEKPDPKQTKEYWQNLKQTIETKLAALKEQVEKEQLEINRLNTQYLSMDLPMEQAKLKTEIDELTRQLETNKRRLKNLQEEYDSLPEQARKAGVPPGWVR